MSDMPATDDLLERRRRYEKELILLQRKMADLQDKLKAARDKLALVDKLLALEGRPVEPAASTMPRRRNVKEEIIPAAIAALRELGTFSHYREIYKKAAEKGLVVTGKDPAANMLSLFYYDPQFRKGNRAGFYGLAEWEEERTAASLEEQRSD
jgi:hypothetical protein